MPRLRSCVARSPVTRWPGTLKRRELLDVHVQQRSRPRPLVAAVALAAARAADARGRAARAPSRSSSARGGRSPPAGPDRVGLAPGAQDRLLLRRLSRRGCAMRTRRAIEQAPSRRRAALQPACHQRCAVAGETLKRAAAPCSDAPSLDREHELATTSQSELGVSVQIHHGPPLGAGLGGPAQPQRRAGAEPAVSSIASAHAPGEPG